MSYKRLGFNDLDFVVGRYRTGQQRIPRPRWVYLIITYNMLNVNKRYVIFVKIEIYSMLYVIYKLIQQDGTGSRVPHIPNVPNVPPARRIKKDILKGYP